VIALLLALATAAADTTAMPAALQRELAAVQHPRMRWGDIGDVRDAVTQGYVLRSWQPLWSVDGRLTWAARRVLLELDSAATRGLDPADYDAWSLEARADSLSTQGTGAAAEFDVMMAVAAARYALALNHGRIDPRVMHPTLAPLRDSVDVAAILGQLSRNPRPDTLFRNLEPHHATYQRLLDLLAQYRGLAARGPSLSADSIASRVHQIGLALERWRWLPHDAAAPWVLVNIPAFQLYALASDREEAGDMLRMEVVAGRAATHPTPLLVTNIIAVQFHPPWLVPPAIALREIRPLALRDSAYLQRQHYELLHGDTVVAATRANVLRIGGAIEVRQTPGPWNALGKIKFVTPNGAAVFLHDTPERQDFERTQRDFSHGCIRVAAPVALSEFALQGAPDWNPERIAEALADTATLVVTLPKPIPVFVVYQTLVPLESGGFRVYPDIYGFDKRLDALLRAGYPFRTPLIP
jgi:murein L,D-transpeptidase YcbB/YkuD